MKASKLTSKFQATIPKEIRKTLKLKAGDTVIFEVLADGKIVIRKAKPLDYEYLRGLQRTLSEWESDYDEDAFKHLQDR